MAPIVLIDRACSLYRKCFVRVDRPNDAPSDKSGKGGWWTYVAQGDPDGRGGRKGMSGKGTGEYRKGQTPSDIASRSGSPEEGMSLRPDLDGMLFDGPDAMMLMAQGGNGNGNYQHPGMGDGMGGVPFNEGSSRSSGMGGGSMGSTYADQAQTLAMAAQILNGYRPDQSTQHQSLQGGGGGSGSGPPR